jgi:Fe-S cluster assembly ATP-binding protein
MLLIKELNIFLGDKPLLSDISLTIADGARHLLRGHNGSGKTTLAQVIAGSRDYLVKSSSIIFNERDITSENTTTRALLGIFLGAQNVPEIPGLTVTSFLKHSAAAHHHFQTGRELSMGEFLTRLESARERLEIPKEWLNRSVNMGFSGGERKRLMFLRLLLAQPRLAILDEPDSGADAASQKLFAEIITKGMTPGASCLIISHQEKFTELISPTEITTLRNGKIVIE